jgi:DNA polymerase-3 subunit alpha
MAAESRHERPVRRGKVDDTGGDVAGGEKLYYHLTLLAESNEGYRNLLKLSSAAYLEGYYYKPRLDWELSGPPHTGLIATTGCLGGVVLQALLADDRIKAETLGGRLQDIFGKDNLFVELQDHGLPEQHKTNPALVEIARRIGAPLLATNDSHYTHREDHVAHDALLCVQTGALIDDPKRFKFEGEEHYLKSAARCATCSPSFPRRATTHCSSPSGPPWRSTSAGRACRASPYPRSSPGTPTRSGRQAYLRTEHRGGQGAVRPPDPPEVMTRLDYELGVIADMGFSAYFLVVWDLIRFARSQRIRVGPGRGSAAGCCVAYCLQIVDLDPIRYDLLFERFLNPGRIQMPDIDMDFDERYRGDMIKYAADRYGSDHVAQIVTFSTIKARAAVRDAARVLGYPYIVGDKIAKAMPPLLMGRDTPLAACLARTDGRGRLRRRRRAAHHVRLRPRGQAGHRRGQGARGPAAPGRHPRRGGGHHRRAPHRVRPRPAQARRERSWQRPHRDPVRDARRRGPRSAEDGLPRPAEPLGDRAITRPDRDLDRIRPDIDGVPLDDPATLRHAAQGRLDGVFQLEGGPMRSLMRSLAPTTFDDVAALVALYRPGPMAANMHRDYADRKNGRQAVTYLHPDLEPRS